MQKMDAKAAMAALIKKLPKKRRISNFIWECRVGIGWWADRWALRRLHPRLPDLNFDYESPYLLDNLKYLYLNCKMPTWRATELLSKRWNTSLDETNNFLWTAWDWFEIQADPSKDGYDYFYRMFEGKSLIELKPIPRKKSWLRRQMDRVIAKIRPPKPEPTQLQPPPPPPLAIDLDDPEIVYLLWAGMFGLLQLNKETTGPKLFNDKQIETLTALEKMLNNRFLLSIKSKNGQ